MDERGTLKIFLDEYEVSSALRRALTIGKKLEEFDLIIKDTNKFSYGMDYKKVMKVLGEKPIESVLPLRMRVKVYFFSSGENCYTMGIPEKIKYCELKKPKIAALLKEHHYSKAKKMLEKVQEMSERVDKHLLTPEQISNEQTQLFPYRKSALLNLTLCLWKLKEWTSLDKLCREILTHIDPGNPKILYRLLVSLYERKDYKTIISEVSTFNKSYPLSDLHSKYPEIIDLSSKAEHLEKIIENKEKHMYSGVLGALSH